MFPNIWPLAGPNIAKRVGSLQTLARGDRQNHFGTFDFWLKPGFWWFWVLFHDFWVSREAALAADLITA